MQNIDLKNIPKNFTKLIVENKTFLSDLKKRGFDEKQISKILKNYHGLDLHSCGSTSRPKKGWVKADDVPNDTMQAIWLPLEPGKISSFNVMDQKFQKDVDYAIRTLTSLNKNPVISSETKKHLMKEKSRLLKIRDRCSHQPPPERLLHQDEKDVTLKAKSITQMTGFQVVNFYNYIKPIVKKTNREMVRISSHHKEYKDKDIFALICEILNKTDSLAPYTKDYIKNLYFNNV
ncbi:MAG: hypothetical protein U9Q84_00445 [Thermodesulfobacteriota bacterium]|nr:hypothetical protein [Thermodesulfobacteriota bacterium]